MKKDQITKYRRLVTRLLKSRQITKADALYYRDLLSYLELRNRILK
jgi:hypothetical protein